MSRSISTEGRPNLLISVRNVDEARAVACEAIDYLDFKSPERGALAPVDPGVWWEMAEFMKTRSYTNRRFRPPMLSAALGEWETAIRVVGELPNSFGWMKMGSAGMPSIRQLRRCWDRVKGLGPNGTEFVAVCYADVHRAQCPDPELTLAAAAASGFRYALLDTFYKGGAGAVQLLGWSRLGRLADLAANLNMKLTLAGRLNLLEARTCINRQIPIHGFGVRGDVCRGRRIDAVCNQRVSKWVNFLKTHAGGSRFPRSV